MKKLYYIAVLSLLMLTGIHQSNAITVQITVTNMTGRVLTQLEITGEYDNGCFPAPISGYYTNSVPVNANYTFEIDVGPNFISDIQFITITWQTEEFDCEGCGVGAVSGYKTIFGGTFNSLMNSDDWWQLFLHTGYNSCTDSGSYEDGTTVLFYPPDP